MLVSVVRFREYVVPESVTTLSSGTGLPFAVPGTGREGVVQRGEGVVRSRPESRVDTAGGGWSVLLPSRRKAPRVGGGVLRGV